MPILPPLKITLKLISLAPLRSRPAGLRSLNSTLTGNASARHFPKFFGNLYYF